MSKDLFDDSTMSFGEHLEVLRVHLWKALIGLVICVVGSLFIGQQIVAVVRMPIDNALREHHLHYEDEEAAEQISEFSWRNLFGWSSPEESKESADDKTKKPPAISPQTARPDTIVVKVAASELVSALHDADPKAFPRPVNSTKQEAATKKEESGRKEEAKPEPMIALHLRAPEFAQFRETTDKIDRPITLNVQEAFMTYVKVAVVAGLLFSSPWVFYQIWLFVAAGLYPHERKYVYIYLPISLSLFLGGAVFCFIWVFPLVLDFLLSFNRMLGVTPQIRLSEWISFAVMLPMMFGISFQLPMVMLFLERISIFEVKDYQEKRRMSILVISILSMLLTPADPASMMLMMVPLVILYELGIWFCKFSPSKSPFETEAA